MLQRVAACCSVLQFGAVCFNGLGEALCSFCSLGLSVAVFGSALQSVEECCRVLQCVAVAFQ